MKIRGLQKEHKNLIKEKTKEIFPLIFPKILASKNLININFFEFEDKDNKQFSDNFIEEIEKNTLFESINFSKQENYINELFLKEKFQELTEELGNYLEESQILLGTIFQNKLRILNENYDDNYYSNEDPPNSLLNLTENHKIFLEKLSFLYENQLEKIKNVFNF